MSTHPNAILAVRLTPDGLSRKTFRDIIGDARVDDDSASLKIDGHDFTVSVFEQDYDPDGNQIKAKTGDIVLRDYITYGYGVTITLESFRKRADSLEAWAKENAPKYNCTYEVFITANYW